MSLLLQHPFYSNGFRGGTLELQSELGGLFERHEVALYLNGHDHDLQHVSPKSRRTHFVTSGAGSKTGRGFGTADTLFEHDAHGFVAVTVGKGGERNATAVQFYSAGESPSKLLYSFHLS